MPLVSVRKLTCMPQSWHASIASLKWPNLCWHNFERAIFTYLSRNNKKCLPLSSSSPSSVLLCQNKTNARYFSHFFSVSIFFSPYVAKFSFFSFSFFLLLPLFCWHIFCCLILMSVISRRFEKRRDSREQWVWHFPPQTRNNFYGHFSKFTGTHERFFVCTFTTPICEQFTL